VIVARRAAALAVALVLSACGSSPTPAPAAPATGVPATAPSAEDSPSAPAPSVPAAAVPAAVPGASFVMALPWPSTGPDGQPLSHSWTGGPHAYYNGSDCLPSDACAADVPVSIRSGIDFGTGGGQDWDVYAIGTGTLVHKGPLPGGFGAGVVTQHGDLFVVYAHMALASLDTAPAVGSTVERRTKLGTTWCTGMAPCTATSGNHHLHLELRSGLLVSGTTVTLGSSVAWDGRAIGGWTIRAGALNYDGTATACGTTITADVAGPPIYDASTCGTPVTPPAVVSASWVAPKDGARLTTSTLTLSAKVSVTPATVSVSNVAFSVTWGSTTKQCPKTTSKGGVWSCKADLWKLGAPLGKLTLSLDVTDTAGGVTKAPAGTRTVTFAAPPAAPTGVKFAARGAGNSITCDGGLCSYDNPSGGPFRWRLTWNDVDGETGYRVYASDGAWWSVEPCGMDFAQLPRELIATLPANTTGVNGLFTVEGRLTKAHPYINSDTYYVVAFNSAGGSKLAASKPIVFTDAPDFVCPPN
jgi:murein DD-endopeptidase MepM/ murein hydrolase activator NlpD